MSYCDECQTQTKWLTVDAAAEVVTRSRRTIYYWIDEELVHARELASGYGRGVCENSLLRKLVDKDEQDPLAFRQSEHRFRRGR